MLIIVEGPDGVGKTTLVSRLTHPQYTGRVDTQVLRKGPPESHPLLEYEAPLFHYRPGQDHVVCDRWHLGEAVYPAVLDRPTQWDVAVARHVDLFLRSRGALVVQLDAPVDVLSECVTRRGDDLVVPGMLAELRERYAALTYTTERVRSSSRRPPVPLIVETAAQLELAVAHLRGFTTYVGPPRPAFLLLGDVREVNASQAHGRAPAFGPFPGTSGHYLLTHLDVPGIEGGGGLANVNDVDDPVELWKALGEPPVVCLGVAAAQNWWDRGQLGAAVPHPQFVRRFHHHTGERYADLVLHAIKSQEDLLSWRP